MSIYTQNNIRNYSRFELQLRPLTSWLASHSFANRPVPRLEQPKPTTRWLVAYPNRTTLHVGRNCASLPLTVSRWSTLMAREVTVPYPVFSWSSLMVRGVHFPPPPPPGNSSSCLANILSSYLAFGSFSRGIPIGPCPTHPCMCTTHPYTLEIPRHSGCELPASLHSEGA